MKKVRGALCPGAADRHGTFPTAAGAVLSRRVCRRAAKEKKERAAFPGGALQEGDAFGVVKTLLGGASSGTPSAIIATGTDVQPSTARMSPVRGSLG